MKTYMTFLILVMATLTPTFAKKAHMVAELGDIKCLKKAKNAQATLDSLNIKTVGASSEEKKLLADVGNTIEELTNQAGAERILGGLTVKFRDVLGNRSDGGCLPAHQLVRNQIHMGRKCSNGMEIPYTQGILVHEIGHFVANKLGLYSKYNRSVNRKCKLTTYMTRSRAGKTHRNRNEEFAEAFAAYLIYGNKLKRKCKKAYEFMQEELFMGSRSSCR